MIPKIALLGLAGEYEVGFEHSPALLAKAEQNLAAKGYSVQNTGIVVHNSETMLCAVAKLKTYQFDIICVCIGTWAEDHHLLDILDYFPVPVIIWAFPGIETGSLCGGQQLCCVLKELNKTYFFVYGQTEDLAVLNEIDEAASAVALINKLKHVRIGVIGGRIKGMTEIAYDELEIKDKTGIRIVNLDENELCLAANDIPDLDASRMWQNIKRQAKSVTSSEEQGIKAMKYYFAMKRLISANGLEGICIKCYPNYMGKICLGYSMLSDEGIVCGCEGDVNNTVSMKILHELTGKPTHNTDLLYPNEAMNTITFSHCGSSGFSLSLSSEDIHLGPVRLKEDGVCSLFPAATGYVTLVNLVGRKGTYRLSAMTGNSIACGMEFPGNPLKVQFDRNILDINRQIASAGIGHHWIGGYGNVLRKLELFCSMKNIQFNKL